jgi:hypothetical protein
MGNGLVGYVTSKVITMMPRLKSITFYFISVVASMLSKVV